MGQTKPIQAAEFDKEHKTTYCIDLDTRDRQMMETCQRVKGRIEAREDHDGHIAVVCFGPSLEETWEQLRGFKYIITNSGAHKFLIDRGIIPTWHCAVDPREHQTTLLDTPHPDVEYLIASVCHRSLLDLLEGYNVKLWHVFSHEAERKGVPVALPRGEWSLTGGSNIGLRSMVIARFLGFRKMTVFGMDYSFKSDGTQHAGWHPDEIHNCHAVQVSGEWYYTNPPMHMYAQQFFKEARKLGDIELNVVGNGLLQAQIREYVKTQPLVPKQESPSMIAAASPQVISNEYVELNKKLHASNPAYGISGSKRAGEVRKLIDATKPASVLDYGCGKGTLAAALPFPIWEYDPAIAGKDATPRPAELVVCTDVLEHVEPEFLDSVLLDIGRCTLKVCYAVIHTGPSVKTLADGRNTHLIQQPMAWWKDRLSGFFDVASIAQDGMEITAILGPKKIEQKKSEVLAPPMDFSNRITPVRMGGTDARFYTPNDQTHWRARTLMTKEPATIAWIDTFRPGEVLYDIGANVGGYTIWASKRRGVKVMAFEPEAGNYALLCKNMALNEVDGQAFCLALSDQSGPSTIYLSSQEVGGSCHSFGAAVGPDLQERKGIPQGCMGATLDSLVVAPMPFPQHIKIDVDGFEHKVIAGMARLLETGFVKSLLVEVNTGLPEHMAMLETLSGYGYTFDAEQAESALRKDGPFKGCGEYVFTRPNAVENHVIQKILDAPMVMEPFPHLHIEDVFPEDFCGALIAALPADGYKSLEEARGTKGYPERFVHDAPPMVDWMRSGKLRKALNEKFGVKSSGDEALLLQDRHGYSIPPHTDTPSKSVTALFYVTRDWTPAEYGTTVYEPLIADFADKEGKHHNRDGFKAVWTAPGKPNSAFIFARTDNSFHGCEPYEGSGKRDILLYDTRK